MRMICILTNNNNNVKIYEMVHKYYRARKRCRIYINERLKGKSKYKSMLKAGYQPSTARNAHLVELTDTYNVVLKETLDTNAHLLQTILNSVNLDANESQLSKLSLIDRIIMAQKLSDISTKLTPRITMKQEETDKDGTKRTLWTEKPSS